MCVCSMIIVDDQYVKKKQADIAKILTGVYTESIISYFKESELT